MTKKKVSGIVVGETSALIRVSANHFTDDTVEALGWFDLNNSDFNDKYTAGTCQTSSKKGLVLLTSGYFVYVYSETADKNQFMTFKFPVNGSVKPMDLKDGLIGKVIKTNNHEYILTRINKKK